MGQVKRGRADQGGIQSSELGNDMSRGGGVQERTKAREG